MQPVHYQGFFLPLKDANTPQPPNVTLISLEVEETLQTHLNISGSEGCSSSTLFANPHNL